MSERWKKIINDIVVLVILLLLLIVLIVVISHSHSSFIHPSATLFTSVFLLCVVVILGATHVVEVLLDAHFPFLIYRIPNHRAFLKGQKVIKVFNEERYVWRWEKERRELFFGDLRETPYFGGIIMHYVVPKVTNPKVREIEYYVRVRFFRNSRQSVQKFFDFFVGGLEWKSFVKRNLFDFNEKEPKKLGSKFLNPLDDKQQKQFKELMKTYLDPLLRKAGLEVEAASFSLR